MEKDYLSRKLAVLLHADVVGSTSLVQVNETLAHERIQDGFQRFSKTIGNHNGIAHEIRGDALVAEFSRASDAVTAALEFQSANTAHNEGITEEIRPQLRVGIAMGEVVVADNTVTGEGIVLAQRLEQLAEPGSVCIQGAAYNTMPRRLPFDCEDLGEQVLKGFDQPVRAYSVRLRKGEMLPQPEAGTTPQSTEPRILKALDKLSIAVRPFTNMSGDSEQEYFCDGITEDIITALSKFHSLSVIGRNSSFSYKNCDVKTQEIASELGVQYVLEGSVRKAGNRLRVNAHLIEASADNHIWAQRYDRQFEDIFDVQDDLCETIVATISGEVDKNAAQSARSKPTENMNAYDFVLRGLQQYNTHATLGIAEARQYFKSAIELDSNYSRPHALLALAMFTDAFYVHNDEDELDEALSLAKRALTLDSSDPFAYAAIGLVRFQQRHDNEGVANLRKSLDLNPNDPEIAYWLGFILTYIGEAGAAVEWLRTALRLNPLHEIIHTALGIALYVSKHYDEAIDMLTSLKFMARWNLCYQAAANAQLGKVDEAHVAARQFVELLQTELQDRGAQVPASELELANIEANFFRRPSDGEHLLDGLRKAGLQ